MTSFNSQNYKDFELQRLISNQCGWLISKCSIGNSLMIYLHHQSNNKCHFSPSLLCLCLWGCKLNFTPPAAGCLGPPGSAERQLLIGCHTGMTEGSRTVCSDLSLYLADNHKQSLSHSLWVTSFAAIEFLPCERRWQFFWNTSMCLCECVDTYLELALYTGKRDNLLICRVVPILILILVSENALDTAENAGIGIREYATLCTDLIPCDLFAVELYAVS